MYQNWKPKEWDKKTWITGVPKRERERERERERSFEQTHPCKWVEVESCLLGQSATDLNGAVEPLCWVHCVVVVLMFVKQWRWKSLSGFLFWREIEVFYDKEVERGRRRGTREIENQNLVFFGIIGFYVLSGLKKNKIFVFFFLNNADVENCGSFKSFGFIYIYIYIYRLVIIII